MSVVSGVDETTHMVLDRSPLRVPRPVRLLLDAATERADLRARLRVRPVRQLEHAVNLVVLAERPGVLDALGAESAAERLGVVVNSRVVLRADGQRNSSGVGTRFERTSIR